MFYFISGGARSGKSALGEATALKRRTARALYLATGLATDEEMKARILLHQQNRAGKGFVTIETPYDLTEALPLVQPSDTVLIDGLGTYLSNLLYKEDFHLPQTEEMIERISSQVTALCGAVQTTVLVSDDVFCDSVSYGPETRFFMEILGRLHQALAEKADVVVECVHGCAVRHKGKEKFE